MTGTPTPTTEAPPQGVLQALREEKEGLEELIEQWEGIQAMTDMGPMASDEEAEEREEALRDAAVAVVVSLQNGLATFRALRAQGVTLIEPGRHPMLVQEEDGRFAMSEATLVDDALLATLANAEMVQEKYHQDAQWLGGLMQRIGTAGAERRADALIHDPVPPENRP